MKRLLVPFNCVLLVAAFFNAASAQDRAESQDSAKPAVSETQIVPLPDEDEAERLLEEARLRHELVGGNYETAHSQFRAGVQQTLDALKLYLTSPEGRKLAATSRLNVAAARVVAVKSAVSPLVAGPVKTSAENPIPSTDASAEGGAKLAVEPAIPKGNSPVDASVSPGKEIAPTTAKSDSVKPCCKCPCCRRSSAKK